VKPPYAVTAVRYGSVVLQKRELFHRFEHYAEPDEPYEMAYFVWLIEGDDGDVTVVDTGFRPDVGRRRGRSVAAAPDAALRALDVDPDAVESVVLTHMHFDHTGNVAAFPRATIVVPRTELDFWTSAAGGRAQFAAHVEPDEIGRLAERRGRGGLVEVGDRHRLAPGIELVQVGGHSPGQQIVVVEDARGSVVLASDSVHFYEELALDRPFAIFSSLAEVYAAYDLVSGLEEAGAVVVPGHDPRVSERFAARLDENGVIAVDVRSAAQRPS